MTDVGDIVYIGRAAEEEYRQTYMIRAILEHAFELQRVDISEEVLTVPQENCRRTCLHRVTEISEEISKSSDTEQGLPMEIDQIEDVFTMETDQNEDVFPMETD